MVRELDQAGVGEDVTSTQTIISDVSIDTQKTILILRPSIK